METNRVEDLMTLLDCSEEQAKSIIEHDQKVDKMTVKECESDLTDDQKAIAKKYRQGDRKPTVYNFDTSKRQRKENPTKSGIIAELAKFLEENSENACENVEITNKERQIAFKIGENAYELTLVQKRKPKS